MYTLLANPAILVPMCVPSQRFPFYTRTVAVTAAALLVAAAVSGCGDSGTDNGGTITITSATVEEGGEIPDTHACSPGDGESPPLAFEGVPDAATSLALVMRDETIRATHWVVVDIPVTTTEVTADTPPDGTVQLAYTPVCPPGGATHTYVWSLYAFDGPQPEDRNPSALAIALAGAAIATGKLTATYTAP